jgi:hypothetical protein
VGLVLASLLLAMAAMHEDVHERASQQQQEGQHPKYVGRVLGDEIEARNREKAEQYDPTSGRQETASMRFMLCVHLSSFQIG